MEEGLEAEANSGVEAKLDVEAKRKSEAEPNDDVAENRDAMALGKQEDHWHTSEDHSKMQTGSKNARLPSTEKSAAKDFHTVGNAADDANSANTAENDFDAAEVARPRRSRCRRELRSFLANYTGCWKRYFDERLVHWRERLNRWEWVD